MLSLFCFNIINAQKIKVINKTNLQPIENVSIFNKEKSKSTITDSKGEADISVFDKKEILFFQHPSFKDLSISYEKIETSDFKVNLSESIVHIGEIVISANKWEQNINEIPNKITSITIDETIFNNPQTSADLLKTSNEVFIQKSQLGGGSPMIRGFAANKVLLVVDGIRMNNVIFRSGNLQNVISIDPNIIEGTEIIFGPGSIIYGSDALGGVMDFHSKTPKFTTNGTQNIKFNSFVRYSSANNENTGHFDINLGYKKLAFVSSLTYSDYSDLKMGSHNNSEYVRIEYAVKYKDNDTIVQNSNKNIQRFTRYDQINFMQKVRFKPNNLIDINYIFHFSKTSDIPRYDRLIQYKDNQLKYIKWNYGTQKWQMHVLNLKYSKQTKLYDEIKISSAYQKNEESRISRKFGKTNQKNQIEKVDMVSLNLDFDKIIKEKNTIFYGTEGIYNYVNSSAYETYTDTNIQTAIGTRYPDGGTNYFSFASYINYKYNFSKNLIFNSGIRYSRIILNSSIDDTSFYHLPYDIIELNTGALNGSIGMVYKPNITQQYNLNISSGFRAPNLDDLAKVFDSEPGVIIVPNKELKPEYAYNIDVGSNYNFNNRIKFDLTVFYTILKDAMVRRDFQFNGQDSIEYDGEMSKVKAVVNAASANIYGGSFSCYSDITEKFSFKTNITYMKGEDDEGLPLRHVSPLFGSTHIMYNTTKLKIDIYSDYNGQITNKNLESSEQNKPYMYATDDNENPYSPSWLTFNIRTAYQVNSNTQINFGVENILDNRYRPYSSGICAPGRNFIVTLRVII